MKNTNQNAVRGSAGTNQQKPAAGGYAIPGDDEEDEDDDSDVGIVVNENVNPDDLNDVDVDNGDDEEDEGLDDSPGAENVGDEDDDNEV